VCRMLHWNSLKTMHYSPNHAELCGVSPASTNIIFTNKKC
jgi:hypothetical protein